MGKVSKVFKAASSILGGITGGGQASTTIMPATAQLPPAQPAPTRREDTGATIVIGADAVQNSRVTEPSTTVRRKKKSGVDVLSGLGAGGAGLNI